MEMIYDVFISYRREGGYETAKHINDLLVRDGYTVSFDIDTLRAGDFDKALLERVEQCTDFLLIVDKHCFDKTIEGDCNPNQDWLRQELAYALKQKKNIIPILLADALFPKTLPDDIENVRYKSGPIYSKGYFDSFYERLKNDFLKSLPRKPRAKTNEMSSRTTRRPSIGLFVIITLAIVAFCVLLLVLFWNKAHSPDLPIEEESSIVETTALEDLTITINGIAFVMKPVEGGSFMMGAQKTNSNGLNYDIYANDNESPVHEVALNSYYIGDSEVTQALWKAVMGDDAKLWRDDCPIYDVSWDDICGYNGEGTDPDCFLFKLNQLTGKNFRLPTEAEWEYAARGGKMGTGTVFSGDSKVENVAWYYNNSSYEIHPVKRKKQNELGLYDMSGNVWEWCSDNYSSGYYTNSPSSNPMGPEFGSFHVLRGGSYGSNSWNCRVSCRESSQNKHRFRNYGFRLALSVDPIQNEVHR